MLELSEYKKSCNIRTFDIEAISLPIVYNKYGDHDPNGLMYVLKEDSQRIQNMAKKNFNMCPPQPFEEVQPLVIRANVGDEIHINLCSKIDRKVSIHVQGLKYDVMTSDGAHVGFNKDTTTGYSINYVWYAENEGVYLFNDMADTRSSELGTNVHGLFGVIIIEKLGSTWKDPVTGKDLRSGLFADIHNPIEESFREYAVFFHDELEIKDKCGIKPIDPDTCMPSSTTAISYRSEPMRNRHANQHMIENPEHCMNQHICTVEDIIKGEDISMSSWVYGDPAPLILRAYVGDPIKIRLLHGGIKETHVFHLHNHQWKLQNNDPNSTIIDSISISPQEVYTLDILYGAGSLNKMIGDAIFHCHLYPHFHEGMWTLLRVFDKLEDGTGILPDGSKIEALIPLKDRIAPPMKDPLHPGYPNFINGKFMERPLQPPLGILTRSGKNKIEPTELERANFSKNFTPGALYSQPCPCDANLKVFEIVALQAKVIYNSYGWNDPQGRFFVLKEDIEAHGSLKNYINEVENGNINIEPLVIRANIGDCIEVRFTNLLPKFIEGNEFQLKSLTDIVGYHIHLVKFDTIVSDGAANGWNNIAGAKQCETLIERFYVNEQLNTIFFHDHLFANIHQQHGLFGALIIEQPNCQYFNPYTGKKLRSGTQAVIKNTDGTIFREFTLFSHDFAFLFDENGKALNPPDFPNSHDDPGVMAINYRCEPMRERLKANTEPAYIFSSLVHGDPATPIFETYEGDPIIFRLLDGAHEEQHAFNIEGLSWKKEITNPASPIVQQQTLGISEAFNLKIDEYYSAGDYMYYYGGIDDIWLGLWGIIRVYSEIQKDLIPICIQVKPTQNFLIPPKDAVIRRYEVVAIQKDLIYNKYKDHDPDGLIFVPVENHEDIQFKCQDAIPLILRANVGEWIEVTLTNMFDPKKPIRQNDYPTVPLEKKHKASNRVSLNPQFLKYDAIKSSGINIGFNNVDQTVGPGESIKYLWCADKEYGTCMLNSFGDLRNHRHHGLFGAIIIEPIGSKYYNSNSKSYDKYGEQVVIDNCATKKFREFVLFIQNGIFILDKNGNIIKTVTEDEQGGIDHEDTGEKGYNYKSERFFNRLKQNPRIDLIFDSRTHGDPATPIFKAYTGENIIIRLLMTADKPRNTGFIVHGHTWKTQPNNPLSNIISSQGAISVGSVYNIQFENGASNFVGDYLYRSGSFKWDIESGMWGIIRILNNIVNCN